ncbi:MAG: flagellar biosynthetic protein FliQ [Bacillaceae bacterium]|jgi:flagellar biosynthetic protein FliQ|uniref:Flagellar biosynthetic protein FliQ n=2 Tax=Aeribacillus TaxID=1055323 RepID=A0A165YYX6_9BACI|nr:MULTISPECIES: flagellar biosynthesis protein FliQ [Aeribacillus]AXI39828.1 flagellar biosynthetic protein FliQ [Bacillaceae bacterium ZC4]REJ19515.1 MAG: flagellar biosynthetic protein FliQ [Bacillaceae bacterium]ASS91546.1 EscS/YscS/HrcS family type III secretion system export apparatus protein [Aeribacillus pallidus]KZM57964.1 EscS/YscS/HrcS family type III secretion system export apparatus protein [Aeribacillus pallidus]KZN97611.1 EscS/YscS/HrcS family type III secretion system export ap
MSTEMILSIAEKAVYTTLMISGPLLLISLVVGLIVSIFQATTQIQEQTLAFIPKIVAVLVGLIIFGPWMLSVILSYTHNIFSNLNQFVG